MKMKQIKYEDSNVNVDNRVKKVDKIKNVNSIQFFKFLLRF